MPNFFLVLDFVVFFFFLFFLCVCVGGGGWPGVADLKYSSAIFYNCPLTNLYIMLTARIMMHYT